MITNKRDEPCQLLEMNDFLYPQYEKSVRTITLSSWAWLQRRAKELLKEQKEGKHQAVETVVNHWKSIAKGNVPFGWELQQIDDD